VEGQPLPGLSFPGDINLAASYERSAMIFSDWHAFTFRVRLVHPINDEGEPVESILASARRKTNREDQALADHVRAVESEAKRIVDGAGRSRDRGCPRRIGKDHETDRIAPSVDQ
jgi:hypothetical protein